MEANIKNKVKSFFKNYDSISLIAILAITILIRFYYFFTTTGQTLWWDEAEYMATAVHWAFDVPYEINAQRPPLFQFLASIMLNLNLGEQAIKLILTVIPSIFLVFSIYLLGKEMYGKKIGLIAALLASFSWSFVFWSARFQPDFLSVSFQVLSIIFMWKFWKHGNNKLALWSGLFAGVAFYFKVSALLVPLSFLVFIFIRERFTAFKEKGYYVFLGSYLLSLVPYFIWSYINFSTLTAFRQGYSNAFTTPTPFGWYNLKFFYTLTDNLLFILFILGIILGLRFLLYFDLVLKDKKKSLNPDLFGIIVLIVVSAFYIFYIRGTEDRWVFLWLPFIFFFAGNAVELLYNLISKYSKFISLVVISVLLLFSFSDQASHFNSLIKNKEPTYLEVKEAGIWLRENANPADKLLSASYTQSVYYSRLNVTAYSSIEGDFENYLENNRPRYLQVSVYERHPEWLFPWIDANNARLTPVKYFTIQQDGEQRASLVVYEIKYG